MNDLKNLLGIKSFSNIVGCSQPPHTCPMIDSLIKDHKSDINEIESNITLLNISLESLEKNEENISKIDQIENQILGFKEKKQNLKILIDSLESDRITITDMRNKGLELRKDFFQLLENCIDFETRVCFSSEILNWSYNYKNLNYKNLITDDLNVCSNYEKIIDWTQAWGNAGGEFYQIIKNKFFCIENDLNIDYLNAKAQIKLLLEGNTHSILLFPSFYKKCLDNYIEKDCYVYSHEKTINNGFFTIHNVDQFVYCKYKSQILGFNINKFFKDYQTIVPPFLYPRPNCEILAMEESIIFEENEYYQGIN